MLINYILYGLIMGIFLISILFIIKKSINKKLPIIDIITGISSIVLFILNLNLNQTKIIISISILSVIYIYYLLYTIFNTIKTYNNNLIIDYSLTKINKSDYDYFIILNKQNKIIKVSNSILSLSRKSLVEIINKKDLSCLFYNIKLVSINDSICGSSDYDYLIDDVLNNDKLYHLVIDINGDHVNYLLDVKNIKKNYDYLGKIITLQRDLVSMVINSNETVKHYLQENEKDNQVKYQLMNLANDLCLYYDYQNKVYLGTKLFNTYTGSKTKTYAFKDLLEFIPDEEKEKHLRDFRYINSAGPYRMKYHMVINGVLYTCIEDAVYLDDSKNDLVSVIHLYTIDNSNEVISTEEATRIIDNLIYTPVDVLIKELGEIADSVKILDNNYEDKQDN